ncbi:MAG: efflux RND transporter permease subunit [Rhodospirillaceae bacterium]|nr:MAG: efflux RND transporter permease subunit [Rhodospirillaceae bacterium]
MRALVAACLRYRHRVAAATLLLLIAGSWLTATSRYDVFPEFVNAQVTVQTEAPGMSPAQVELSVTKPLETSLLGAANVEMVRSDSIAGLSVVSILFKDGADPVTSRQAVAEAVAAAASRLPAEVSPPHLSPLTSSTMDLLKIGLVSDKLSPAELRTYGEWVLKPRILAVPGVAHVNMFGGDVEQFQVQIDPVRLAARGLAVADIANALRHGLAFSGGGTIDTSQQRVIVEFDSNQRTPAALAQMIVGTQGTRNIRLEDVANVVAGPAIKFGDAYIQGKPGVLLTMASQYGSNTLTVTKALEASLAEVGPDLKARGVTYYPALHRPANFIEIALGNLTRSLLVGGLFIAVVLMLFLRDWRSALISFLAIPVSLMTAVAILSAAGVSLNTMTMGGFAVALGILVDDAVIYLENIMRRLRENRAAAVPLSTLDVIAGASVEIFGAVVYATVIILVVFLPVVLLHGIQGKFVGALAIAVILAVTASLVVALTITPALAALLLSSEQHVRNEPPWLALVKARYVAILRRVGERPRAGIVALGVLAIVTAALTFTLKSEFMPSFREGHFVTQINELPGTSIAAMANLAPILAAKILAIPEVDTVEEQIGRAEQGEDTVGPYSAELHVELKHDGGIDQDAVQRKIRDVLQIPGLRSEVLTFLGDRLSETLTGETAQFVVRLTGTDLDVLDRVGRTIVQALAPVAGIADLQAASSSGGPAVTLALDPARLSQLGVNPGDAGDAVATAFNGEAIGQVFAGDQPIDVVMMLLPSERRDPDAARRLPIRTASGAMVPLGSIAFTQIGVGRENIQHQGGQRALSVTFNSDGRSPAALMDDVRRTIAEKVALPTGVIVDFGGVAEAQRESTRELAVFSLVTLLIIGGLLVAAFRRKVLAAVALLNLPFALIGGLLALVVTGQTLSLGATVGLITVFGVSARNAILMLSHFEHLELEMPAAAWTEEMITRGAVERFTPVVMTALITALGLVPLAFGLNQAGYEIEAPLAIVVLGGLISSSTLCLLALPSAALWAVRRTMPPAG